MCLLSLEDRELTGEVSLVMVPPDYDLRKALPTRLVVSNRFLSHFLASQSVELSTVTHLETEDNKAAPSSIPPMLVERKDAIQHSEPDSTSFSLGWTLLFETVDFPPAFCTLGSVWLVCDANQAW
jgi:hypothetical protein